MTISKFRLSDATTALRRRLPRDLPSFRRTPLMTPALMLLLVAIVGAAAIAASDRGRAGTRPARTQIGAIAHLPLVGTSLLASDTVLVDSDLPSDESPIWVVRPLAGRGVLLTTFTRSATNSYTGVKELLRVKAGASTRFAVAGYAGTEGLYMITPRAGQVTVSVVNPSAHAVTRVLGRVPVPAGPAGTVRSYFIAHWSGTSPDLFVVDRGSSLYRLSIGVYRVGVPSSPVLSVQAPVRGLPPSVWEVQLARIGSKPDLALITRQGVGSHVEVHVLTGASGYQRFSIQQRLALSSTQVGHEPLLIGDSLGSPSVLALHQGHGDRVDVFPLLPVPPVL